MLQIPWEKIVRKIMGFKLGLLFGLGFHYAILRELDLEPSVLKILGGSVCIMLAVGCVLSEELQCVGLICVTMFCSRTGRRLLQAMIFAYLLSGPGQNIIFNGREVARSFGCSAELAYNMTKEYGDLVVAPFKDAMLNMKQDDADAVGDAIKEMDKMVKPLSEEINVDEEEAHRLDQENDYIDRLQGDTLRSEETHEKYKVTEKDSKGEEIEKKYMENLERKCEGVISRSTQRCREGFAKTYDSCYDRVSGFVAWLICWPMKVTVVCDLITALAGSSACDAREGVDPGFGEALASLTSADQNIAKKLGKLDIRDAASSMRNVMAKVKVKIDAAEVILLVIRRLLALLFLPVILESVKYVNCYLVKPRHDNIYLTSTLILVDKRRVEAGRTPTLLPLRRQEKTKLVDVRNLLPNGPETKNIFQPYIKLVMLGIVAGVFLGADYVLCSSLQIVADHSRMTIAQKGHHVVHITVKGSGFVAKLVRSIVEGFNTNSKVDAVYTNEDCLPKPRTLPIDYHTRLSLIFLGMAAMVLLDHFPTRVRRIICTFFYPKRERQRVILLYNELLKNRVAWQHNMRQMLSAKAEKLRQKEENRNPMLSILERALAAFKRYVPKFRRTCVMCETSETRENPFVSCISCPRGIHYCPECWKDLQHECPACSYKNE